jgi:UDP-N-acetylmuramate dehydrogenase
VIAGLSEHVPLAPFTTIGVGGSARYFLEATSERAIIEGAAFARANGLALFVLGGGSNLLVADEGFNGLVIHIALKGTAFNPLGDETEVSAAAGEDWGALVEACVERELAGFECLSGIPGSVGGTPIQNVGAYGQEVSDSLTTVRCYDRLHETIVDMDSSECGFRYRTSIFNTTHRDHYVVLRVSYRLRRDGVPLLKYEDLRQHFTHSKSHPSLREVREAVLAIRSSKGMVIDAGDADTRSAGSFFKNPVLSREEVSDLIQRIGGAPLIALEDGRSKIPAAWLIERAGFRKGETRGRVGISHKHALAIINRGSATAAEILAFSGEIRDAVRDLSGLTLQIEPVLVGFQSDPC